jgi:DNA-binding MarR family transcriptional regulator
MQGFVDDYLPALLAQASHLISGEFHAVVRQHGVSVNEWRVLATLASAERGAAYATGELAQITVTKQPTLSRLLDRLLAEGLVQRLEQEGDRRYTLVGITPKGSKLVRGLIAAAREHEQRVLEPFGLKEAETLKRTLRGMIQLHRPANDA